MLNELKDLVGEVSVLNASNPLTATIFTPEETANIADITLNPEVNSSSARVSGIVPCSFNLQPDIPALDATCFSVSFSSPILRRSFATSITPSPPHCAGIGANSSSMLTLSAPASAGISSPYTGRLQLRIRESTSRFIPDLSATIFLFNPARAMISLMLMFTR